jgi:serine-type D-Ala-D-Ala carboxypeptidase/endopeptidase
MKKTTLFLAISLLSNLVFAQQKLPEDLVQSIQKRIEFGHTPSVVVGIIDKDGPRYSPERPNADFGPGIG